jgi:cell division control protein 6
LTYIDVLQVELKKDDILQMKQQLDSKNQIFAEKRYLESLGPPITIVGRKKQARKLLELLYVSDKSLSSPFVSVYGKSGTGKSTVVKFVCGTLSDSSYLFVNLRRAKTNFGCANLILENLDCTPVKSYEGINKAIDKIESKIIDNLNLDKKHNFILILDEFDVIFSDVRSHPSDFVYKLLDMIERTRTRGFNLSIVAISNSNLFDYVLDDRVKSRMDNCDVFFPPYDGNEILQILHDRAKKAFVKKPNVKVLEECAKLSSAESGDCRRALQLLRLAGESTKGNVITIDDVKQAYKKLDTDKLDLILESVTTHQKFLLASLAQVNLWIKREFYSTKQIFEGYQSLCGQSNLTPLSYRRAFDLLADLENSGIIISKTHSTGRHGYHNYYKLTYDYRLVGWIIDPNWWDSLMDEKKKDEIWLEMEKDALNPKKARETAERIAVARNRYIKRFYGKK